MPLPKTTLEKYACGLFIETGTFQGAGIATALRCGAREIHSIEIDPRLAAWSAGVYHANDGVKVYEGDSAIILPQILAKVRPGAYGSTVWLDAHPSWDGAVTGEHECPVVQELRTLAEHWKGRSYNVLIDDVRLFREENGMNGVKLDQVEAAVACLGDTQITFERGLQADDILAVRVNERKDCDVDKSTVS